MIPEWMTTKDEYVPPRDGGTFALKTLRSLGRVMARLRTEDGQEGRIKIPAIVKLFVAAGFILAVSLAQGRLILMALGACILISLALKPADVIWSVLKPALAAGLLTCILYIPAVIIEPAAMMNGLRLVYKVALSVITISLFNRTTQWNHITGALRKLHVPALFVFTLDMTLRYIVLLGKLMEELLTALNLRSVGRNSRKYTSVGGIMGVTFLRGTEMNREMYEAMQCRGFTDDYKGLEV
ncbi:MAG: hypothetical protein II444_04020 [Firmicutes bacterium]|nr:hypothetical protein [Bacillota bacterium]